ncbi:MAG: hypothetical protein H6678_02790 [Candidatus Delongbacteria bacterium]|nr:hypothetical protein [Candidatus Delongbacteria bacterium]
MNWILILALCLCSSVTARQRQIPAPTRRITDTGTLERVEAFPSDHVQARAIEVWLPPDSLWDGHPLPVLYMHDGQNLFEDSLSFSGVDWNVDSVLVALSRQGFCSLALLVGIANTPLRRPEYMPDALYAQFTRAERRQFRQQFGDKARGDDYLRFLVEELKPWIDASYPTLPDRDHTVLMGSSRGALISLAAMIQYPQVFGAAACLSTHWPGAMAHEEDWLRQCLPEPDGHLLYVDHGDRTLDADYPPLQRAVNQVLREKGWLSGRDFLYRSFPGHEHSEAAWRLRLDEPLMMLLPPLALTRDPWRDEPTRPGATPECPAP